MASHVFAMGQSVRIKRTLGLMPNLPDLFRVTGMLPPRGNQPQYRLRSDAERHERVMTEDDLEAAAAELHHEEDRT